LLTLSTQSFARPCHLSLIHLGLPCNTLQRDSSRILHVQARNDRHAGRPRIETAPLAPGRHFRGLESARTFPCRKLAQGRWLSSASDSGASNRAFRLAPCQSRSSGIRCSHPPGRPSRPSVDGSSPPPPNATAALVRRPPTTMTGFAQNPSGLFFTKSAPSLASRTAAVATAV